MKSKIVRLFDPITLGAIAFLAHGMVLFNRGLYWDGWVLLPLAHEAEHARLSETFRQQGSLITQYLYEICGLIPGVYLYRFFFLISLWVIAVCFQGILIRGFGIGRWLSFLIAALSLVLPFSPVIFEVGIFPYPVYTALFFAAVFRLVSAGRSGEGKLDLPWMKRIAVNLALIISFTYSSLLFLFAAYPLAVVRMNANQFRAGSQKFWGRLLLFQSDILLTPLLFWTLRELFFKPQGNYAGYNAIQVTSGEVLTILKLLVNSFREFFIYFYEILRRFSSGENFSWFINIFIGIAVVALTVFLCLRKKIRLSSTSSNGHFFFSIAVGAGFIFLARLPYLLVGRKINDFVLWESRDNFPIMFGFSATLMFLAARLAHWLRLPRLAQFATLVFIFSALINFHWQTQVGWLVDALKQKSLMINYAQSPAIKAAAVVLVEDQFKRVNMSSRYYRSDEFTGQLADVYPDERRIAVAFDDAVSIQMFQKRKWPSYFRLSNFRYCGIIQPIVIREGQWNRRSLLWGYLLRRDEFDQDFRRELKKMVLMELLPIEHLPCSD